MENAVLKQFAFNFKDIIIDEIALEGLDGILLDLLWRRIEKRVSSPVTTKMIIRFWNCILDNNSISVYELPEPRPYLEIMDRFTLVHFASGQLIDPPDYLDGPYEYCPLTKDDYGSCVHYSTRTKLNKAELRNLSYEEVFLKYKDTLVLVASIEERWKALVPHQPFNIINQLTPLQYCMIELIGRSRENGQTTVGKSNLPKIIKDPKLVYYNRKQLKSLELIKIQSIAIVVENKTGRVLLVRLRRFHKPKLQTMPKVGIIHDIVQHILQQPGQTDTTEAMLKMGIMHANNLKRIVKSQLFKCVNKPVYVKEKDKTVLKRFVTVNSCSDESSQSEDEGGEGSETISSQYNVKVSLTRQAYERISENKDRGLSLIELAKILNVEFYTARMILRCFKKRKIIKEFNEDIGRIRIGRFVAVSNIYNAGSKYYEEQKKFQEYLAENEYAVKASSSADVQSADSDSETPRKKIKLEDTPNVSPEKFQTKLEVLEGITETTTISNVKNSTMMDPQKKPTLRQLKYANGIIKILKEKQVVSGILLLNVLVSREVNEPQMDSKNLKSFVQSLASTGKLKIMKVDWPGYDDKCTYLFTAPHVQVTDSIIRAKYKEIYVRALKNMKTAPPEPIKPGLKTKPLSLYAYQKYTKLKKLHMFLMNLLYFEGSKDFNSSLPPGFSCFVEILPEFSVEFAVGCLSEVALTKLPKSKTKSIHSMFHLKLADVPSEIFRIFVASGSFENGCLNNIRLLALCGLLQLIEDPKELDEFKTPIGHVFYVNRRATILDTTGKWPRPGTDNEELKKSFLFETMEDVNRYWDEVLNISTSTEIELKTSERTRKTIPKFLQPRQNVYENDNGQVWGDGQGPCGFDSMFFMDVPRLWSDSCIGMKMKLPKLVLKKISRPKVPAGKKVTSNSKPTLTKILTPTVDREVPVKEKQTDSHKLRTRVKTRTWPLEVDRIIMLCKAALTVMSPVGQPGCITLRNTIIKYLLTLMGSKSLLRHMKKRIEQLEVLPAIVYERDCVINELKRRSHLMKKYEGAFDEIKREHSGNLKNAITAARVVMLELVWTMMQLMKSKSFNQKIPCVAADIQDFHKSYTICASNVNTQFNSYKTPPEEDPTMATLKEGIVQALAHYLKGNIPAEHSNVILKIFKPYPELKMRQAIEELHRCGAIAAKEKSTTSRPHKFFANYRTLSSSFRISEKHRRIWICRVNNMDFIEKLTSSLEELPQTGLNGSPEVNCFLSEMTAAGLIDVINETVPVLTCSKKSLLEEEQMSVTDLQMNYSLKTGTIGWRAKKNVSVSERFKDVNWNEPLDSLIRNAVIQAAEVEENDIILSHLKEKKELGADFHELQAITGYDIETLQKRLEVLESSKIITRLGYFENIVILPEYAKPWTLNIEDRRVIPTPWLLHDLQIKPNLFLKWMGTIVNKIFKKPGCSIAYIADLCEFISTRAVLDICTVLEKYKCVTLKYVDVPECDLFSDDTIIPEVKDYNPYGSVHNIIIFPTVDILTRYAYFRQLIETYDYDVDSE